jgi:hypothetical protein
MSFLYDPLLGNFLKLAGISVMESSSSSMLPIGIAMAAYKMIDSDMVGGGHHALRKTTYSKKDLIDIYDQIMTMENRKKVINDLLRLLKKISITQYDKLYKLLKDMSIDPTIKNKTILRYFSKNILLMNLQM